jgi:hypothetical protein
VLACESCCSGSDVKEVCDSSLVDMQTAYYASLCSIRTDSANAHCVCALLPDAMNGPVATDKQ